MAKKIRLGYDILSKRAIETESGDNIDDALRRKDQEIADINTAITNIEGDITNIHTNFDFVVIDPEHGDDANDGLTRNTPVKTLSRAAEVYVEKFGGSEVRALVINTHGIDTWKETKSDNMPSPSNTSNLFLPDLDNIDKVYLYGDNSICISNADYQNESGPTYPTRTMPTYELHLKFEKTIAAYLNSMTVDNESIAYTGLIDFESINGDVYMGGGSYGKELKSVRAIAKNGRIWWSLNNEFNVYAGITTEYEFESLAFTEWSPICGKSIRITTLWDELSNNANTISSGLWCKGDIYIRSLGTLVIPGPIFCSGRVNISSIETAIRNYDNPTLTFRSGIMGRGNDDQSYISSDPTITTYPTINIDWAGTVLISGAHCKNLDIRAWKFALYATGSILSQNDIIIEADYISLHQYSTSNYIYSLGKMQFMSPNEIKIAQYLFTDELVIDAGGRPNDYPINYSDYKYPYWSTDGVTGTSDINCKITNLFESILGTEDPVLSTEEAHYFIKCSGDYADQWSTIGNGNAIVSLEVGGHAFLANNGGMITKRLSLRSKSLYVSYSFLWSSSFDIKTGQLFWKYGQLFQWYNYGASWDISSSKSSGMSWTNDFEDRSSLNCDSLEQLDTYTTGFVHPGYGQKRRDWDINIKVLVPYRGVANYYSGGTEYCAVLGSPNQGSFNGSIAGEIGDVLVTDQKQSPYSHDWILPQSYQSYYENNKFGNNVTLHISHRKWHHVYIDMDQGSDAYDGMSKETPVKSTYGLDKVFKQMLGPSYVTIHVCGAQSNHNRGSTQTQYGPYSSIDFSYVIKTFEGGLLYNWYAAYYLSQHLSEEGVPTGWRVPTRSDFTTLRNTGNNEYLRFRVSDLMGTDQYGFSDIGQKGYYVDNDGVFGQSRLPNYWTSEEYGTNSAYYSGIQSSGSYDQKYYLYPMRLVRDNTEGDATGTTGTVEIGGTTYNTVVIGTQVWITKNLEFKFSGGTFRDSLSSNHFDRSSTPQYGYYNYGNNLVPYSMNDNPVYSMPSLLTIVADDPYLSATVKGPIRDWYNTPNMLKMYGFHTLNVLDCYASVTDLQASVDLYYVAFTSTQSNYPKMNILRLRGGNVYTMGIAAGYNTAIEADNNYRCLSGTNNTSSGNSPGFYGATYIHAKYIDFTGNQCTFASGICGSLIADTGFRFGTPIKFEYGSLSIISNGSGNIQYDQAGNLPDSSNTSRCYFGIGNWYGVGNISLICPNQDLYVYTWGQTEKVNGRLLVEANELTAYSNIYGCDIDIRTKNNAMIYANMLGDGGRASLVNIDCGGTLSGGISTRCCNMKVNARKLENPINLYHDSNWGYDTNIYVNTEYSSRGIFSIDDPIDSNYNLFARVTELAGPFYVYNGTPPLTDDGSFIKKFKGIVEFYTGSDPDNDLADFRDIAPNADFELIVLNRAKQLVAGQGISISDTGDEVVISSDPKSTIVQKPVTIDNGTATVQLTLNRYNVITGIDSTVTDLVIDFPVESTATLLTEIGFEFYLDAFSQTLNSVTFTNSTEQLSSIVPDEFTPEHIYQGVLVNRCITLVEYDRTDINALEINGKKYRTVKIGEQTWMAENLADPNSGVWYDNDQATYEPLGYGKLYTAAEAEALGSSVPGWHLATENDFNILIALAGGDDYAGAKLKSTTSWDDDGNGTDDYGFNIKPAGALYPPSTYQYSGAMGKFWTSTKDIDDPTNYNCIKQFNYDNSGVNGGRSGNTASYSARLVKDMSVKIGGRDYKVVHIGNQLWMAENLDWKFNGLTFRDGTTGNEITSDATIAQGAYYNYDESTYGASGNKYGMLYNWTAADYINQHLSELKVPDGWHVPTLDEWTTLATECGGVDTGATKLKSAVGWNSGNGLDSYGFTAFPAGLFTPNFSSIGEEAYFWISNESDDEAYYCYFDDSSFIDLDSYYKIYGYSLRLVKNLN